MALEYRADLGNVVTIEDPQLVERVAQPVASVARIRNLISGLSVAGVEPRTRSQMLDFDRSGDVTLSAWILARRVASRLELFRQTVDPRADFDASRIRIYRDAAYAWGRRSWFSQKTQSTPRTRVPQPTTAVLMGIGLIGLAVAGRRYHI